MHYCAANKVLYVADTYNHKIKIMKGEEEGEDITLSDNMRNWLGVSTDKNPRVLDGAKT